MFLHPYSTYFHAQGDIPIPCRVCATPFYIKNGICYEGLVATEFHEDGSPKQLNYVKAMLCSLRCIIIVAVPDEARFEERVTVQ